MSNALSVFNSKSDEISMVGRNPETIEERKAIVNGLTSPDYKLGDFVNMTINISNFYVERAKYQKDDGTETDGYRIVLIDDEGKTYTCGSTGVANALKTIIGFFGLPEEWGGPLPVRVKQILSGDLRILSLEVV